MGADGGTISTNRKYLRAAKSGAATGNTRREQRERQRAEELTTCALGGAPLSPGARVSPGAVRGAILPAPECHDGRHDL